MQTSQIKRTKLFNERNRPDAASRHQIYQYFGVPDDRLDIINPKDLEWLSWNWVISKNNQKYESRKHMVYAIFNAEGIPYYLESYYLPSP